MRLWLWLKKEAERLGHLFFYLLLLIGGQPMAYAFLYPVLGCYVLSSRAIHRELSPYLDRRFPEHGWWLRRLAVFRIVLGFGKILVDRAWLGLKKTAMHKSHIADRQRLDTALAEGSGAVMVLAHVGTWQNALAHMADVGRPVQVMIEHDAAAVTRHFYQLGRERPFGVIDVHGFMGGMLAAKSALARGEVVMVMGDRYLAGPAVEVDFFGRPARLPAAPYVLAASVGVPLVVAFSAKVGMRRHIFHIWDVMHPDFTSNRREQEIRRCAARFAADLEAYLVRYPYQWYNFFDFWAQ